MLSHTRTQLHAHRAKEEEEVGRRRRRRKKRGNCQAIKQKRAMGTHTDTQCAVLNRKEHFSRRIFFLWICVYRCACTVQCCCAIRVVLKKVKKKNSKIYVKPAATNDFMAVFVLFL